MHAMLFILQSPLVMAGALQTPVPVILDTDLGDDIDDTWALAMALGCPEIDLKLIVTAWDDTPTKTRLVAKILDAMGRTDIPIGTGKKTSSKPIQQAEWLGDYSLDAYPGKIHEDGVQSMIDCIRSSAEPVTLCVIGPQTNIAEALARNPSIAEKARVVSMAGSVYVGYQGSETPAPEYNVREDVGAAQAVFAAPWPITLAPLDICGTLQLAGERYMRVAQSEAPRAATVIANYEKWTRRHDYPPDASSILFDTVAVYLTCAEALCEMETVHLRVESAGKTVPDEAGRPVRCALRFTDRDAFEELLVRTLTGEEGHPKEAADR